MVWGQGCSAPRVWLSGANGDSELDHDLWQQQALVGTTQCCRGDGARAWQHHRAVGSCSCRTPSLSALAAPTATVEAPLAFPKGHTVHHSPWLRQRAQWNPLWEREEQKSCGSSLSTGALWHFVPWQGHCRQGSGGWWWQVPQSSPSWASVHVHWFKNKLQLRAAFNVLKTKCKIKEDYLLKINKGLHSGIDFLDYYF